MSKLPGKMTRKQHWVPRFYLRHFADSSGQLHAYNKSNGVFYRSKVEDVCSKRDLYEVKYSDIEADSDDKYYAQNLIEAKLSESESQISVSYSRLLQCCKDAALEGDAFRQGRQAVCKLASNLIVRHPATMLADRNRAREDSPMLLEDVVSTEEEKALLDWSGWNGDHKALAELSVSATLLFPKTVPFRPTASTKRFSKSDSAFSKRLSARDSSRRRCPYSSSDPRTTRMISISHICR